MRPEYIEIKIEDETIYIRRDRLQELTQVDVVVFDCDGVMLDVRQGYNNAIAALVIDLTEAFTGTKLPVELFDGDLNYAFKRTGGFNNDWTHAYAVFMRVIAELPAEDLARLNELAEESLRYEKPLDRYNYIKGKIKAEIPVEGLYEKLYSFAKQLDATGIKTVDRMLLPKVGVNIKKTLRFPGDIGESIVSTMFEELFGGAVHFKETHGIKSSFTDSPTGYIENEIVTINQGVLDQLEQVLGGPRFGVASGAIENTARHKLGTIVDRFPVEAQLWHDVVDRLSKQPGQTGLHKPNPFPLIRAAEPFKPYSRVLFIGDTMADYLTAENAGEGFLFMGVYGYVHLAEDARDEFLERGSSIVASKVTLLPMILSRVKAGQV